jgi:hypothetical protein
MRVRFVAASAAILALTACALSACGSTQPTKTVTVTTATTPGPTATTSALPAQEKRAKTRRKVRAASAMRSCDANIAIKRATTSCAFAENVFYGYWNAQDQDDDAFTAYSAVAKQSYPMSCTSATTVVCRAGDGAEVRFRMAAIRAYTAENAAHYAATHDTGPSNPRTEVRRAPATTAVPEAEATAIRTTRGSVSTPARPTTTARAEAVTALTTPARSRSPATTTSGSTEMATVPPASRDASLLH